MLSLKGRHLLCQIVFIEFYLLTMLRVMRCEEVILKCDEFERNYEPITSDSFCTVSGFMVSHSQNVKIQRYPKANMTEFIKFYDSRLLYLPFKLFDVFPNVKTLDVSLTEILDIPRNTFGSASRLSYLNMSYNNITQITTSVFMGAVNLISLDLRNNRISRINEFAFHGLGRLDKLILSFNQLKDISRDIFLEKPYLETVNLDNNQIEYIEPEVFSRLRRICDVNLSNNRIKVIEPHTFEAAYNLEYLVLSANQLNEFNLLNKTITTQLYLNHNNLTKISINGTKFVRADHNRISEIEMINSAFLENLELSNNNISDIVNITNLPGLLVLDLSYNPIRSFNITTFDRMKRLRSLSLRAAGIRQLMFGMFSKQHNLDLLDLAYNNMTELNLDIFVPYLANLKQFFIDGNNLTSIQGKCTLSTAFPNLMKLGLSQNRFNCSYLHALLTPPYLSSAVALHIVPDDSDLESTHIRDVSCISDANALQQSVQHEIQLMTDMQRLMHDMLLQRESEVKRGQLNSFIVLLTASCFLSACISLLVYRYWQRRGAKYCTRRGGSVVFHSNATVNSNMEQ